MSSNDHRGATRHGRRQFLKTAAAAGFGALLVAALHKHDLRLRFFAGFGAHLQRHEFEVFLFGRYQLVGHQRVQVFVASEYQPPTCEYRAILDHENQHVSVDNGALKEFAPRFRAEVEKILATQQPVFARDGHTGTDAALAAVAACAGCVALTPASSERPCGDSSAAWALASAK